MEKCVVCNKEIIKNGTGACLTCFLFLAWKYKRRVWKQLGIHKENAENLEKEKTKFKEVIKWHKKYQQEKQS